MTSSERQSLIDAIIPTDRSATHYSDAMLNSYLEGSGLKDRYELYPELSSIKAMIQRRSGFETEKRHLLSGKLKEQYERAGIKLSEGPVLRNIERLNHPTVFTITTGQQIHLGLGPLYVLYKILNVLRLAEEAEKAFPDYGFVPVFWMATEDHDLEEIRDVAIYGKTFTWKTEQTGAVGRMSTGGIAELWQEIEEGINLNEALRSFIAKSKKAYQADNLADATRILINDLFGDSGLLVLDGDQREFKALFRNQMIRELSGSNTEAFQLAAQAIDNQGHSNQVFVREINLFLMEDGKRERIELAGEEFRAGEKVLGTLDNVEGLVDKWLENLSPNVLMRPLYEECILPNLIYVAGPSELKYWLQLKELFQANKTPYPLLFLRTSALLIPEDQLDTLKELEMSDWYKSEEVISQIINNLEKDALQYLDQLETRILGDLEAYKNQFGHLFKGYNLEGKISKIVPKVKELGSISKERFVHLTENQSANAKYLKLKRAYFSTNNVQERNKHLLEFSYLVDSLIDSKNIFGFENLRQIVHLIHIKL